MEPEQNDLTPARRARLSQDRSREKRQVLLDAALDLYRQGGRMAVTHRAVAERAEVSVATVGYYFAGVDELVHTAISETLTAWTAGFRSLCASAEGDLGTVLTAMRQLLGDGNQEQRLAAWQVYVTAMADPELAPLVSELLTALQDALESAYADAGVEPEVPLLNMIALIGATFVVTARGGIADDVITAMIASIARFVDASGPAGQALAETIRALDGH